MIYNTIYSSRLPLRDSSSDFTDGILYSIFFEVSLFHYLNIPGPHQNFRLSFVIDFQVWQNKNQLIEKFYLSESSCELQLRVSKILAMNMNIIHNFIQYWSITLLQLSSKFPGMEGMIEQNLT